MFEVIRIVVIEDHAFVRGLIDRVAEDAFRNAVVTGAREGRAGIELCQKEQPHIVLLDLELPDADGFELVQEIRAVAPAARIVILSAHTEPYVLHRVRLAKVEGFVDKNEQTPAMLADALRKVAAGGNYFSGSVEQAMARYHADPQSFTKLLSEREQDLLRLLGQGHTDVVIAERLGLSQMTVRNHRHNIMTKVGAHSTPELIRYAIEHGFSRLRAD